MSVECFLRLYPILASSPRESQEQWAAIIAAPGRPRPSARSCPGQGQDRRASVLLHVFVGFYGGNPGEHGENMQTPHRKAREQAPTCCTMQDLNPQPFCCEATMLRPEPPCHPINEYYYYYSLIRSISSIDILIRQSYHKNMILTSWIILIMCVFYILYNVVLFLF